MPKVCSKPACRHVNGAACQVHRRDSPLFIILFFIFVFICFYCIEGYHSSRVSLYCIEGHQGDITFQYWPNQDATGSQLEARC